MPSNASEPAPRPGLAALSFNILYLKGCSAEATLFRYDYSVGFVFAAEPSYGLKASPGQIGVELTQLGRVCEITFDRSLYIFTLHLDRFIQRLYTKEILHCLGAVLE